MTALIIVGIVIGYFLVGLFVLIAWVKLLDPLIAKDRGLRAFLWILWPATLVIEVFIALTEFLVWVSDCIFRLLHLDE